ncbi:unnamed protein product [Acidithrix sp. C25]|nr:unnamed protein product [Acidithrix sp. C25]
MSVAERASFQRYRQKAIALDKHQVVATFPEDTNGPLF